MPGSRCHIQHRNLQSIHLEFGMVSSIDTAKRALVTLLKSIAVFYGIVLGLTRESTDVQVRAAFKKVSRKARPEQQNGLKTALDTWEAFLRDSKKGYGGDRQTKNAKGTAKGKGKGTVSPEGPAAPGYRFQGVGVLLTYQKFSDTGCWEPFLEYVKARLVLWKVLYWKRK